MPGGGDVAAQRGMDRVNHLVRQVQIADIPALATFYNGLSNPSKRTFRPLGDLARAEGVGRIVLGNHARPATHHDLVAVHPDGIVAGWGFVWHLLDPEPMLGLAVVDPFQGQGLGRDILARLLADVDTRALPCIHLTVVHDNFSAIRLYEQTGFQSTGSFVHEHDGLTYLRMVRTGRSR